MPRITTRVHPPHPPPPAAAAEGKVWQKFDCEVARKAAPGGSGAGRVALDPEYRKLSRQRHQVWTCCCCAFHLACCAACSCQCGPQPHRISGQLPSPGAVCGAAVGMGCKLRRGGRSKALVPMAAGSDALIRLQQSGSRCLVRRMAPYAAGCRRRLHLTVNSVADCWCLCSCTQAAAAKTRTVQYLQDTKLVGAPATVQVGAGAGVLRGLGLVDPSAAWRQSCAFSRAAQRLSACAAAASKRRVSWPANRFAGGSAAWPMHHPTPHPPPPGPPWILFGATDRAEAEGGDGEAGPHGAWGAHGHPLQVRCCRPLPVARGKARPLGGAGVATLLSASCAGLPSGQGVPAHAAPPPPSPTPTPHPHPGPLAGLAGCLRSSHGGISHNCRKTPTNPRSTSRRQVGMPEPQAPQALLPAACPNVPQIAPFRLSLLCAHSPCQQQRAHGLRPAVPTKTLDAAHSCVVSAWGVPTAVPSEYPALPFHSQRCLPPACCRRCLARSP